MMELNVESKLNEMKRTKIGFILFGALKSFDEDHIVCSTITHHSSFFIL